jgi:pimeloyl-ACP methyl ester carboxylesterase
MDIKFEGKKVFAATGGKTFDPSLPTVVFVHGAGMDHTAWSLQMRYFAWHGRGVLALDLPGHGKSDGPALTSAAAMTDWVMGVLDHLGVAEAAIAGHSLGAFIALDAGARYPDRTRAIALVGVSRAMPVNTDLQALASAKDVLATNLVTSWGFGRRAHLGGGQVPGLWMLGGAHSILEQTRTLEEPVQGIDFLAADGFGDATALAGKVRCPVLFLLGAEDRMTPPKAARPLIDAVAAQNGSVRVVTLPNCGHMIMSEFPGETLDALKTIL